MPRKSTKRRVINYRLHIVAAVSAPLAMAVILLIPLATATDMPIGTQVPAPLGYVDFCNHFANQCSKQKTYNWAPVFNRAKTPTAPAPTVHLTRDSWNMLRTVNLDINQKIRPVADPRNIWTLPILTGTLRGDCKAYVLEKRRALMAAGMPMGALSITIATTAWGELHAVLVVHTDRGDFVLDNLSPWVTPWSSLSYRWGIRQMPGNPAVWVYTPANPNPA
jgi:predicted transglutaminase-like cysteine proteinase